MNANTNSRKNTQPTASQAYENEKRLDMAPERREALNKEYMDWYLNRPKAPTDMKGGE